MPMVYNHSGSSGNRSNVFATILWCDVNYRAWQDALRHSNSVVNGQTIYWTNAIKPLLSCTGGNTTVYADQTTNAGNWSLLGRFNFAAGTSGSIRVTDSILESGRVAMVDGLKMVLAVPNRPHLDGLEVRPGGEVRLHISGCPGYYSIEAATTFGNWSELTNLITTTHCFQITLPPPGQPSQFYRAKLTR